MSSKSDPRDWSLRHLIRRDMTWPKKTMTMTNTNTFRDHLQRTIRDMSHLRHHLQFWQLRNWIYDNLCYLTIKSDTGQQLQFLRCLRWEWWASTVLPNIWLFFTCTLRTVATWYPSTNCYQFCKKSCSYCILGLLPPYRLPCYGFYILKLRYKYKTKLINQLSWAINYTGAKTCWVLLMTSMHLYRLIRVVYVYSNWISIKRTVPHKSITFTEQSGRKDPWSSCQRSCAPPLLPAGSWTQVLEPQSPPLHTSWHDPTKKDNDNDNYEYI